MAVTNSPTRIYEACFVEMGKTLRTAQFYPITHPAFQRSLERSYLYVTQLLKRVGSLDVTVTKGALLVQENAVTGNTSVLAFLAGELFRRRVKSLHFDPALDLKDYQALFRLLSLEPHEIGQQGGPEKTIARSGARNIWINALKFDAAQISDEREDEDEPPPAQQPEQDVTEGLADAPAQHPELYANLQKLAAVRKLSEMKSVLAEIVQYARKAAGEGDAIPASLTLQVLVRMLDQVGEGNKAYALLLPALRAVATQAVVESEIRHVCRSLGGAWKAHAHALHLIGPAAIPFVFQALAASESRKDRQRLIDVLLLFGDSVRDPAVQLLQDSRWFVVRNAIDLLGERGDTQITGMLLRFVDHEHPKVRIAAREALRKLGGNDALAKLLESTEKGGESDRRHAVAQLAFFPAQSVMPKIIELIAKAPAPVAEESMRVLSELDPPDMLDFLSKVLAEKPGLLNRRRREHLRRVAAELVCLRLPESWPILRPYAADQDPEVRKWVARAVEWVQQNRKREAAIG